METIIISIFPFSIELQQMKNKLLGDLHSNNLNLLIKFFEELPSNNFNNKISFTKKLNEVLEELIKKNPNQWIWTHDRWK